MKHVTREMVDNPEIPVPTINEQRRIAAILDAADALRVKRRATLTKLETLSQSIFRQIFGDPISNSKNWPQHVLRDLTKKITDGEHLNPEFVPSGMPMVMAGNVLDDFVDIQKAKKVDPVFCIRKSRYVICSMTSSGFEIPPVQKEFQMVSTWLRMSPVSIIPLTWCHLWLMPCNESLM